MLNVIRFCFVKWMNKKMQCTFYFQFLSLTTSTNRNPRGITFSDASRDLLLVILSNVKSYSFHISLSSS